MIRTIGLTGGIASGKTTISELFRTLNVRVIDADVIARDVVKRGRKPYEKIVQSFGNNILLDNGEIDRQKLGKIIFAQKEKRELLNQIVHPAVRKQMLEERDRYLKEGHQLVVLDIPLLFEGDLTHLVDKTIVVYVRRDVQFERLVTRNQLSTDDAEQRIASQMPLEEKVKLADATIDNNGTVEESCEQLKTILRKWRIFT
ncbi:MAG TPA: dephospho-CoA kinase [Bacillota bacterium]|nr:dephospho-CoA kinase [Bacillota bacterium]